MRAIIFLLLTAVALPAADGDLQKAKIGDFKLVNGQTIRDCVIGYRTFGTLNARKSNAVLFPTWFSGRSEQLKEFVGAGKMLDPAKYFVVLVDALGDGVSSSPSNSTAQPRMRFPEFGIRDMVESQHRLLTEKLGVTHLHAVMGISMGGMQTFQWITAYPGFMDLAIPIVGSPQLNTTDLLLWNAELHAIEGSADWKGGNYTATPVEAMRTVADIHTFALSTPDEHAAHIPRSGFAAYLKGTEASTATAFDTNDWVRQLQAMIGHDVARDFGGSLDQAARAVKAKVLVVASAQDHMVNPHPALDFAPKMHAKTLLLEGNCGHLAPGCEGARLTPAVAAFLAQ